MRLAALIFTVAALAVPTANAGLLGTGSASYCDTNASQPFRAWGDYSNYVLTPGGSFESSTPAWSMSGGARIVTGNETFYVNKSSDSRSLYLPAGSSVSTPSMCFAPGDWHLRLFAVSSGSTRGLKVTVTVRSALGILSILDGGTVSPTGTWQPSNQLKLTLTNVTGLLTTKAVSFNFTPIGFSGAWRIDDVYLDPWVST